MGWLAAIPNRGSAVSGLRQTFDTDPQTSDDIAYPYTRPHSQTTHTAKIFPNCGYNFKSFLSSKNSELEFCPAFPSQLGRKQSVGHTRPGEETVKRRKVVSAVTLETPARATS